VATVLFIIIVASASGEISNYCGVKQMLT